MKNPHTLIINDFQQPYTGNYNRVLQDREELIEYPPNFHSRIWYNTEPFDYENHYHNCVEIIYMHDSECIAKFPTKNISLNTGDIIIIPPYMMHQITGTRQSKQFVIMMDTELLMHFDLYATRNSSVNDILLCNKDNCPQIYDEVKNNIIDIINAYFINESFSQIEIYSHFLMILSLLGKNGTLAKATNTQVNHTNPEHYDKFAEVLQYIDLNYSESLSLDTISNHIGFSKFHFIRLFKDYTGMTFYEYLTNKRIQHAKELLKTNMGITDIAFTCGFNNQTSFCRTFKKEVGCPPSDYRQSIKNE